MRSMAPRGFALQLSYEVGMGTMHKESMTCGNRYVVDSYENINQGYDDYNGHVNADLQRSGPGPGRV